MTTVETIAQWSTQSRARFWSRVEKTDSCWNWTSSTDRKGYGQFCHCVQGLTMRAHKLAWESENGPVPDGLVLDHLCRNRRCVRPSHLEVVTNRENVLRGIGITAQMAQRMECDKGHELNAGKRECEVCTAERYVRKLARGKANRSAITCGHPTPNGTCGHRIARGRKCRNHEVWNQASEEL